MGIRLCKLKVWWRLFKRRYFGIPLYRTPKVRELGINEQYIIHRDDLFIIKEEPYN